MVKRFKPKKARREARLEWVGGRFSSFDQVGGEGDSYRPEIVVWLEPRSDRIVHFVVCDPRRGPSSLGEALEQAPQFISGPRPTRIRVARREDAADIRERCGASIEVMTAPTPEIQEAAEVLQEIAASEAAGPAWFEEIPADASKVSRFFAAARSLYDAAPWTTLDEEQVLRIDVPGMGLAGACLSLRGSDGECAGMALYPSYFSFQNHLDACDLAAERDEAVTDFGSSCIAVDLDHIDNVPQLWLDDLEERRLPFSDPDIVPCLLASARDGSQDPATPEMLDLMTAIARAVVTLFAKHKSALGDGHKVVQEVQGDGHPKVRLSLPYEAGAGLEASSVASVLASTAGDERSPAHDLDGQVTPALMTFAATRFREEFVQLLQRNFDGDMGLETIAVPFALYCMEYKDRPLFEHFLNEHSERLSPGELAWLEAQRGGSLSYWEVSEVKPGEGLTLLDVFTGERCEVFERSAAQTLTRHQVIFCRVVPFGAQSVVCGMYPRSLMPTEGDKAIRAARARLRFKKDQRVDRGQLRGNKPGLALLRVWQEAVAEDDARRAIPPQLQNNDGDPILLTTDHFRFAAADRGQIHERLLNLDGAMSEDEDGNAITIFASEADAKTSMGSTVIGHIAFRDAGLRVQTNSLRRADALRKQIEDALGELATHRAREHSDPISVLDEARSAGAASQGAGPAPEEMAKMASEFIANYMQSWADESIPALGNKTPRKAVKTKSGRTKVELLLREMEAAGGPDPEVVRTAVESLRRELGF